jgi:dihydroorotase
MNADSTAKVINANKDVIVGVKVAHYTRGDWIPIERGEKATMLAGGVPMMVDFGGGNNVKPPLSIETLFTKYFKPGDIYTHCFGQMAWREFIIDTVTKKPKPFVLEARKKGIIFDVGYGGISFSYSQGLPAVKAGFYPNSISTDLHITSMNAAMKDMLTCMSKFMAMGMPFNEVIAASTWNPAKEIRHEELGNLSVGSEADIAILGVRTGTFGLFDSDNKKLIANKKLECEMTIRNGQIAYDLNGRAVTQIIK